MAVANKFRSILKKKAILHPEEHSCNTLGQLLYKVDKIEEEEQSKKKTKSENLIAQENYEKVQLIDMFILLFVFFGNLLSFLSVSQKTQKIEISKNLTFLV